MLSALEHNDVSHVESERRWQVHKWSCLYHSRSSGFINWNGRGDATTLSNHLCPVDDQGHCVSFNLQFYV